MTGAHLGDRLSVLLDGELSATERAEAETHVRSCAQCARELEELATVDALAREVPVAAPAGYFDTLPGRVRARIRQRRRLPPAAWTAAAAAAVIVLVSVVAPLALRRAPDAVRSTPVAERAAPAAEPLAPPPPVTVASVDSAKKAVEPPARRAAAAPPALAPSRARDRETAGAPVPRPQAAEANRLERGALAAPADALAAQAAGAAAATSQLKAEEAERADGFADRPASPEKSEAAPAAAAAAPAERKLGVAGGGGAFAHPDRALMDDQRYRSLAARRPASAEEARALSDAWELFARDRAGDPRADEARVRAIEAGLLAWRRGGASADLDTARRRGLAYLADAAARQRDRVRAALDGASPAPRP